MLGKGQLGDNAFEHVIQREVQAVDKTRKLVYQPFFAQIVSFHASDKKTLLRKAFINLLQKLVDPADIVDPLEVDDGVEEVFFQLTQIE